MGLVLVGAGIGLLCAKFNNRAVVDTVLMWWPLIFILLGAEVLCLSFLSRDKDSPPKLKYDIFSILIILVIVIGGLGFQALDETGVAEIMKKEISYKEYQLKTASSEIPLESGIKKLVIEAPRCHLKVYTGKTNTVSFYGNTRVRAESEEMARRMISKGNRMASHVSGISQYISFDISSREENMNDCSIFIPQNIDVEIHNVSYSTQIFAEEVENNWLITGNGAIRVSLPKQADLEIQASVAHGKINGNVPWNITDIKEENDLNDSGNVGKSARVKLGAGNHRMTVNITAGAIIVNQP